MLEEDCKNSLHICRICVENHTDLTNLSEALIHHNQEVIKANEVLNQISNLQVVDPHLYYICNICIERATVIYIFKEQCDLSTKRFEQYVKNIIKQQETVNIIPPKDDVEDYKSEDFENLDSPILTVINKDEEAPVTNEIPKKREKTKKDDLDILPCKICNKIFKNKYILIAHLKRHENKGHFLCNECGKTFSSKSCLIRHTRVHTGEKKYLCTVCNKRFPSANNLNLHSRRHSGIRPYLCTSCGKSFSHPTGLTYHMRTHTQERPFTCETCGKSFIIQCHLDRHTKIHTGEKPFTCAQCGRGFIKKIDLQRHEAIHTGEKPYVCSICKKAFLRKLHLNYHMMVHTSERPHECPTCGKGFIRRYYLSDHIKKHHAPTNNIILNT